MRKHGERRWRFLYLVIVCCASVSEPFARGQDIPDETGPLFGLTPFPYDLTLSAIEATNDLVAKHGDVYGLHFDDGIPWAEALSGEVFPRKLRDDWDGKRRSVPPGMPIYLGLSPLSQDRESLAAASDGSSIPRGIRGAALDAEPIKQAFYNYAHRAIETFDPKFVNLGIEAGELAERNPSRWAQFVRLYEYVRNRIKREQPDLQIGISFGLQSLMDARVARRARSILDKCDYLGVSFYPYMSRFHEKLGSHKLPDPPRQWTQPLEWLRDYTDLPLAICETGYTTQDVHVPKYGLHMPGSPALQAQYVRDLGRIARRDHYLFVIWFLPIDYDKLYAKLPEGDGTNRIWRHAGLLDQNLNPKPAWDEWNDVLGGGRRDDSGSDRSSRSVSFVLSHESDMFRGSTHDSFTLDARGGPASVPAMKWQYSYDRGRWQWGVRKIEPGTLAGASRMRLQLRSDRSGPVFIQLEEAGGETYFLIVDVSEQWQQVDISLMDLKVDPEKKRDGVLQIEDVRQLLVADNAAQNGPVRGSRSVWFADWGFERSAIPGD